MLSSEILISTHVTPHIRLPESYTKEDSRPTTPNFAEYPIRVDDTTIYEQKNDPNSNFNETFHHN